MGKSLRDKAVMAMFVVVVLYAAAAALWFFVAESSWKKAAKAYGKAKATYAAEVKLIGEKRRWNEEYESAKAMMPTFDASKATETTWLRRLDALALTNRVVISRSNAGAEVDAGEVLELPITATFEGSLEGLVKMMHQLENSNDGMFDITVLSVSPSKNGYLKGNFVLNCAYMRK